MVDTNKPRDQRHAHFDEDELNEYDKQRGKCMKIDDPKTPFEDEDPYEAVANDEENKPEDNDPIVEAHLREAQDNSVKNAQLLTESLKKYPSNNQGTINIGDLLGKLGQAKEEQDEEERREEEEAERKCWFTLILGRETGV